MSVSLWTLVSLASTHYPAPDTAPGVYMNVQALHPGNPHKGGRRHGLGGTLPLRTDFALRFWRTKAVSKYKQMAWFPPFPGKKCLPGLNPTATGCWCLIGIL